ncbi:hypothetical protein FGE12_24210 [Aggregicoccus sp. 17bor-14]|uniref:hypothetical protein n=1 Tax=Myxococcaceae TaxID=31 RepID=UPI00129C3C2F|nr:MULTISPECIES: hypothetical protein [Myxococcaceae]MBF5045534.1 hypothetical protein [Simulacricoccus sp. 17bor-14]MRI91271.1 hypothetical protein [Aggregicoccus sp. 17bor-14]
MNCPGCSAQVAKDAAICPHCDFIIDGSFISGAAAAPEPLPAAGPRASATAAAALPGAPTITDPAELFAQARAFVLERTRSDRLALGGLGLLLFSCFMPWRETAEDGDILGLMSLGALAFAGALLALGALYARVRAAHPRLGAHGAWLLQLGTSAFCVFWCVVCLRLASDSTSLPSASGSYAIVRSTPSFGLFLALLGALGALGGALLALRDPAP